MEEDDPPSLVGLLQSAAQQHRLLPPDFTSPNVNTYLDHIVSLPLSTLLKEPASILVEASSVESELTNLCYREYSTFITVHKCSAAVRSAFDDFDGSLGQLLASVPDLEEGCRAFGQKTLGIQAVRGRAVLVQEHQDKLQDLLELPQLMETCVRNGYYQDAMELAGHAESMAKKHGDVQLVQDVAKEVQGVAQIMVAQLLALLREPVKLPTLIKAVSFLRRLGSFDEIELGLVFLISRLSNFRAQLVQLERDRGEPIRYVRKYIDHFREHVYDIISQFTAIFHNFDLVASFASQCVGELCQLVTAYIPRIATDPASLSSILVQLGYCALSFSRVGLDFSALITEPFNQAVLAAYSQSLSAASSTISSTLRESTKSATSPTETLMSPEQRSVLLESDPDLTFTDDAPAPFLAHLPPLALFVNAHLVALNAVRLLAPIHLTPHLAAIQADSLASCTAVVLQYLQQALVTSDLPNGDRPRHNRTPSSPRAHLLRRNTETQLSPEVRALRRRETQKLCVVFGEAWRTSVSFLTKGLRGIFEKSMGDYEDGLRVQLSELALWTNRNKRTKDVNGGQAILEEAPETNGPSDPAFHATHTDFATTEPLLKPQTGNSLGQPLPEASIPSVVGDDRQDQGVDHGEEVPPASAAAPGTSDETSGGYKTPPAEDPSMIKTPELSRMEAVDEPAVDTPIPSPSISLVRSDSTRTEAVPLNDQIAITRPSPNASDPFMVDVGPSSSPLQVPATVEHAETVDSMFMPPAGIYTIPPFRSDSHITLDSDAIIEAGTVNNDIAPGDGVMIGTPGRMMAESTDPSDQIEVSRPASPSDDIATTTEDTPPVSRPSSPSAAPVSRKKKKKKGKR